MIIGDSIIKDIKPYKMKNKINKSDKLYVKSFSGANIDDMRDYIKPTLRRNPDLIILHAGSNELHTNKTPEQVADGIMTFGLEIKSDQNEIIISGITSRTDIVENEKCKSVNFILKAECERNNILFIDKSDISNKTHLNGSGLHLNYKGSVTLASNFISYINI